MEPAFLDISDSNLQLWSGGQHLSSPGYALLAGQDYRFGREARSSARLEPRNINTRYWWQLSTEPLQPALGPARHTGDLVHAHLKQLHDEAGKPAELLLAAPGSMQRDQLSLLLGIVQQCPFDIVGLVHRSVALGSIFGGRDRLFHLEVQLHQSLVTELAVRDGEVSLARSTPLPGTGFLQLQERLVEIIAAGFIRQTRFDPRRKASTEQQLYDALGCCSHWATDRTSLGTVDMWLPRLELAAAERTQCTTKHRLSHMCMFGVADSPWPAHQTVSQLRRLWS